MVELDLENQKLRNTQERQDNYKSAFQSDQQAMKQKLEELER